MQEYLININVLYAKKLLAYILLLFVCCLWLQYLLHSFQLKKYRKSKRLMYKIAPETELIFKIIHENIPSQNCKLLILFSILKKVALTYIIALIMCVVLYSVMATQENKLTFIILGSAVFNLLIMAGIYYTIKKFILSLKLYRFAVGYFDRNINDIADYSDSNISGYLIDYLCIESTVFDDLSVESNKNGFTNYGELRTQILKAWNKNKSPKVPFGSEAYSNYLHALREILGENRIGNVSFRELYEQNIDFKKYREIK